MKYLTYLNILLGDNHVYNSGNCKKGICSEDHLGIKKSEKPNSCRLISTKNVTLKNSHIDITVPNNTNIYSQNFKIFILMLFMNGT